MTPLSYSEHAFHMDVLNAHSTCSLRTASLNGKRDVSWLYKSYYIYNVVKHQNEVSLSGQACCCSPSHF